MVERIKAKLKSDKGASLVAALLLFVICAVVGSVIIAAASQAMGRLSESENGDDGSTDRYYLYSYVQMFAGGTGGNELLGEDDTLQTSYACYITSDWEYYLCDENGTLLTDEDGNYIKGDASDAESIPTLTEEITAGATSADSLNGIVRAMALQFIREYWDSYIVVDWVGDNLPDDHTWQPLSSNETAATKTEYLKLSLDAGDDTDYESLWCIVEMDANLDIEIKIYPVESSDYAADMAKAVNVYYITIPFSDDSLIKYSQDQEVTRYRYVTYLNEDGEETTELMTLETYNEKKDDLTITAQESWRFYKVTREISFADFGWDGATVTTIEPG